MVLEQGGFLLQDQTGAVFVDFREPTSDRLQIVEVQGRTDCDASAPVIRDAKIRWIGWVEAGKLPPARAIRGRDISAPAQQHQWVELSGEVGGAVLEGDARGSVWTW